MEEVRGSIERITYQNAENGYTVAKLQQAGKKELLTVVGSMAAIQPGETIACHGHFKNHVTHGLQFVVTDYRVEQPADIVGIEKYLGSGLIKGIGPIYAKRIVATFGKETLSIIDKTPERLSEVPGIGKKRRERITSCWQEMRSIREVMIFLQTHGVTTTYAHKIFKMYGQESIQKVKENPYALAHDIFGIGFKTADKIAFHLGIEKEAPIRIRAGIEYVLEKLSEEGHVAYPRLSFLKVASDMLEIDPHLIEKEIGTLKNEKRIEEQSLILHGLPETFLWSRSLYLSEIGIARELNRLKLSQSPLRAVDAPKALTFAERKLHLTLAKEQREAVSMALHEKLLVITGGPGTGKSTITSAILAIMEKLTQKIHLAAPTGRAAKRLSEITHKKASTLHSLLQYNFKTGEFKYNSQNPLDTDLLIIDEASMIDTPLLFQLLKALPNRAKCFFIGDVDQLPSVGPGCVLKDLIDSKTLPTVRLQEIFRQGVGSLITLNAHRINKGLFPLASNKTGDDFFYCERETPEEILDTLLTLVAHRLPKNYGFHPHRDIQVLSPMRKGLIGIENLNSQLQALLNPSKEYIESYGRRLSVGDKVMQRRNNYEKEVFNGDVGTILSIDAEERELSIRFDEKEVFYDFTDLDELQLAYAVSVHKYQGSECPCIVMPLHTSHFKLLYKNLLYTAVTRGKKLVILIGNKRALMIALRHDDSNERFTGLKEALIEKLSPLLL